MNIKPENRRLLEALSFIDDSIVSDMLAEIKIPDAPQPRAHTAVNSGAGKFREEFPGAYLDRARARTEWKRARRAGRGRKTRRRFADPLRKRAARLVDPKACVSDPEPGHAGG